MVITFLPDVLNKDLLIKSIQESLYLSRWSLVKKKNYKYETKLIV